MFLVTFYDYVDVEVRNAVIKFCSDHKISFEEFCVIALDLLNKKS